MQKIITYSLTSLLLVLTIALTACSSTSSRPASEQEERTTSREEVVSVTDDRVTGTSSAHSSSKYRDDIDQMYDEAAAQTKADLRQACREAGADYDEMFDDAEIDEMADELKAETRQQMHEMGY